MPIPRSFIATAAVSFGIVVSAAPALATNSQAKKVYPTNTSSVKGGTGKHKKNPTEPS